MIDEIAKIIKKNKKVEEIVNLEERISELKIKISKLDKEKDKEIYDRLMCEEAIKEMQLKASKKELDKDSLELLENINIFSEYNRIAEKIKKIEKQSKKSNDVVLTANSEGRKKEIDSDFIDYYNKCVETKSRMKKSFTKAFNFLNNYEYKENKREITIKEEKRVEKNDDIKIIPLYPSYTTKKIEEEQTVVEETKEKKIPFIQRMKKYAIGVAVGIVAIASLVSFGGSKDTKNNKTETKSTYEEDDIALEDNNQNVESISFEEQISMALSEGSKEDDLEIIITDQEIVDEEVVEEDKELTIGDNLEVSETSRIMRNQYDATNYENGLKPYYDNDEERTIEGVVYRFADGTIKTARSEEDVINYQSIDGAEVTAYLTYSKYGVEGFYSIQDVENDKVLSRRK